MNLIVEKHAGVFGTLGFLRLWSDIRIKLLYDSLTYPACIAFEINLAGILENLAIYFDMRSADLQLALCV